ncbi:MAG: YfiR family protein [Ferruginibacter sp.]
MIILLLSTQFLKAQTAAEYQVKAVFLYNFTRFVDWPAATFESATSPFVIGILGNDPFGNYIDETVSGESTGEHPIVIKRFKTVKDIDNCQILFINSTDAETIKSVLSDTREKKILTVSDANNFASLGGIIGFFIENNKIRMQINTEAAKAASLSISSKLLGVAKIL